MKMTLPYNLPDKSNSELYSFEIKINTKIFYCLFICKQEL